jgi:hypothetical protein
MIYAAAPGRFTPAGGVTRRQLTGALYGKPTGVEVCNARCGNRGPIGAVGFDNHSAAGSWKNCKTPQV